MIFDHSDDDSDVKKIKKTKLSECDRDKWITNVNTKRKHQENDVLMKFKVSTINVLWKKRKWMRKKRKEHSNTLNKWLKFLLDSISFRVVFALAFLFNKFEKRQNDRTWKNHAIHEWNLRKITYRWKFTHVYRNITRHV